MGLRVADALVVTAVRAGVECVYGVIGDSLNPVGDAIRRDGRRHLGPAGALEVHREARRKLDVYVRHNGGQSPVHPESVAAILDGTADDDAIFVPDTGMSTVWACRYLQMTAGRRLIGSFNHGSMANAMPQAIGAQVAFPHRQVVAMCGDGGLTMLLDDLSTIATYELPIKIIVFNNGLLDMVHWEMLAEGIEPFEHRRRQPRPRRRRDHTGCCRIQARRSWRSAQPVSLPGCRSTQPGSRRRDSRRPPRNSSGTGTRTRSSTSRSRAPATSSS
jgi:thiamine pyrophosphate-dependent acetolactate synthase large subunit-like protein